MIEANSNEDSRMTAEKNPRPPAEEVADRLNVSRDWVWDHSGRLAR
jgi:hypothetical protein